MSKFGSMSSSTSFLIFNLLLTAAVSPHRTWGEVSHETNPVYQLLLNDGIVAPDGQPHRLPAPSMDDDITQSHQADILKAILGDLPADRFLRDSQVAQHICRLQEIVANDSFAVRQIDIYFVVHVDLDQVTHTDFLSHLGEGEVEESEEATGRELTNAELQERKIPLVQDSTDGVRHESYAHGAFTMLNQVELQVTGRSYWTKSANSMVAATLVDPRFADDSAFPNAWRSVKRRKEDNGVEKGMAHAYQGAGSYMKITRLAEPPHAVLVEGHTIFVEPRDWFGNPNQVRGKIPAVVQTQIRAARREMVKGARQATSR